MADSTIILTPTAAPVSSGEVSTHVRRYTAHDAISRVLDHLGTGTQKISVREAKRAVLDGYREINTAAQWTYLYTQGRLNLNGVYQTGTIAYDHTGGTYERQLTLTSGTWPDWATNGLVRISGITYKVSRRISDTVLVLDETFNPQADVDSGTSYAIAQDSYDMPTDFVALYDPDRENIWGGMCFIRPQEWNSRIRTLADTYAQPLYYTFMGERGRIVAKINPPADEDQTIDFVYYRKPREISVWEYTTGTATVDKDTYPLRITVSGGTFTSSMVGSVIRLSSDASTLPTEAAGDNPAALERTINVLVNSTTVEVDEDIPDDYTAVKYRVSDPVDLEDGMLNAFWRCIERQAGIQRIMQNQAAADQAYFQALRLARENDSRVWADRSAGWTHPYRMRLKDFPLGSDQE